MRIASRCLPRQRAYLSKLLQRSHSRPRLPFESAKRLTSCDSGTYDGIRSFSSAFRSCARKQDAGARLGTLRERRPSSSPRGEAITRPAQLVAKLDKYLPLTVDGVFPRSQTDEALEIPELTLRAVDTIYLRCKAQFDVDLFEWMIVSGYRKAAIWIIGEVLRKIAATTTNTSRRPPSNISWQNLSLLAAEDLQDLIKDTAINEHDYQAVELATTSNDAGRPAHLLLNAIWTTLGRLVLKSADLDVSQHSAQLESSRYMSVVCLTLGHMHKLGFMPDNIYAYNPSLWSTFVQRPPILHLISSRILASISDATWRDNLGDAIAQATERGISLANLTEAVIGSRFLVRLRDLGPEVWLELILWCCVETDQRSAAVSIIRAMQDRQDNPWFAVAWNPSLSSNSHSHSATIDWDQVRLRTGGTVGSIEGYSLEKPFVDVPLRTISVEVVLAIVELCLNTCVTGNARGPNAKTIDAVQTDIADAIAFLEPHDLPPDYLDYLGNRLIVAADFESVKTPSSLQKWASHLQNMQRLETTRKERPTIPDLSVKSILSHSQFLSSVQQQALDRLIQSGDVHNSLQLFNDIQETIDRNKVNAIREFLQPQQIPEKNFFSARPFPDRLEYVDSYGQLPNYRIASFLNLLSENNMTGMGQWLLYDDEVDGAVIPPSAYQESSMATALLKFALVSQDGQLRHSVLSSGSSSKRLPTVRFLRQLVNTQASTLEFTALRRFLKTLKSSAGGGAGVDNVVHIAATLIRLENGLLGTAEKRAYNIKMTTDILEEILRGDWNTVYGTFPVRSRRLFLQNMGYLLKVFACTESRTLEILAQSYIKRFPSSNLVSLPVKHFNVLLSAMVDAYGSSVGRKLWVLFCGDIDVSDLDDADSYDPIEDVRVHDDLSDEAYEPMVTASSSSSNALIVNETAHETDDIPLDSALSTAEETLPKPLYYKRLKGNFSDPFFPEVQEDNTTRDLLRPMAITRPDMQTVRIIVGAALKEQKQLRDAGLLSPKQDSLIAWTYWMFKSIAAADEKLIEQEIQQPVEDLSKEIKQYLDDTRKHKPASFGPFPGADERVSALWIGRDSSREGLVEKELDVK